jgi:hypothetical protein
VVIERGPATTGRFTTGGLDPWLPPPDAEPLAR